MSRPCLLVAVLLAVPLLCFSQAGDDPGIIVNSGGSLLHRAAVHYPKASVIAGTVEIEASLNSIGEVADARVVSGPEELRKESLSSVLQWHYGPDAPAAVQILIRFNAAPKPTQPNRFQQANDSPSAEDFVSGVLRSIEFYGVGSDAENELRARLHFQLGDPLQHSDLAKIMEIVNQFDDHLIADITGRIAAPDAHRDLTVLIHAAEPMPLAVKK